MENNKLLLIKKNEINISVKQCGINVKCLIFRMSSKLFNHLKTITQLNPSNYFRF